MAQRAWPYFRRWLQPDDGLPPVPPPIPMPKPPVPVPPAGQQPDLPPMPPSTAQDGNAAPPPLRSEDFGVLPGSPGEAILFDGILAMANPDGRRGGKEADRSNQILLQECEEILANEFPHLRGRIRHISGSLEEGKADGRPLPEKRIASVKDPTSKTGNGSSYADVMYGVDRGSNIFAGGNTVTMGKDGAPTSNELRRFINLVRNAAGRFMGLVPKLGPGVTEDDVRKASGPVCRGMFKSLETQLAEEGQSDTGEIGNGEE